MNPTVSHYTDILNNAPEGDHDTVIQFLSVKLPAFWCGDYEKMTFTDNYPYSPAELDIVAIPLGKLTYLYDMGNAYDDGDPENPRVESRIVAVYGRSQPPKTKRDKSRIRGWLGPTNLRGEGKYDKGHFIAQMSGGGLDINLFFQRRDINRGWSKRGKVYRQMERYCAEHFGTFCFSRPLYNDRTWQP
ncbi:MAG: DNA/RNA non-specific endonuclease, partial [Anaerolineae bacterium]|nr:DNA/RNA non-specific endonuclease [Anaerolineae bacterium]